MTSSCWTRFSALRSRFKEDTFSAFIAGQGVPGEIIGRGVPDVLQDRRIDVAQEYKVAGQRRGGAAPHCGSTDESK